jgi:integrase/recombinase XerD
VPSNLYKRGRTWWGRTKVAGRDHRRSLRTSDRAEAKKRLETWLKEFDHARFHGEARHTYKEMAAKWATEYLPGNVKPGTARRYLVSSRQLDPHFREIYLDELDRKRIARMVSDRVKLGATNATIRRDLTALSTMLSCAIGWGWIEENPAKAFDRGIIKERRDPIQPPPDESVDAFVAKLRERGLANFSRLVAFLGQTGLRENEAVTLEWHQVDAEHRQIRLTKTKTNRPRVVQLSDLAWGTLEGTGRHTESKVVFWHGAGLRYKNFASRFAGLQKALGFKFRAHDLRHKFAIDYLRAGGDIYTLQGILGHASIKTTEIYLGNARARKGAQY